MIATRKETEVIDLGVCWRDALDPTIQHAVVIDLDDMEFKIDKGDGDLLPVAVYEISTNDNRMEAIRQTIRDAFSRS